MVLLSATKGAESPGLTVEAASLSAGPAEVRGTGVKQAKRVVAGVVEADGDGVGGSMPILVYFRAPDTPSM